MNQYWFKITKIKEKKTGKRVSLSGPCTDCNSETSYIEKDGYMHWYSGPNGTICKRCWNNFREKAMLPGLCVRCNTAYTHHGWTKTPEGTICVKCKKSDYSKIKRGVRVKYADKILVLIGVWIKSTEEFVELFQRKFMGKKLNWKFLHIILKIN